MPLGQVAARLDPQQREEIRRWCSESPQIAALRPQGLWADLHDRAATYPPFLRAQEHSAQIVRPILQMYEERFKKGEINLLNCSTTMEMGVDIPNVSLIVNANVPPSASNYRQRVGRAGRRGEAFASAMTFCRDLPLDWIVFDQPPRLFNPRQQSAPFGLRKRSNQFLERIVWTHHRIHALQNLMTMAETGLQIRNKTLFLFRETVDFRGLCRADRLALRPINDCELRLDLADGDQELLDLVRQVHFRWHRVVHDVRSPLDRRRPSSPESFRAIDPLPKELPHFI